MVYFFYGPDSYRRNEKLRSSIAEYRKKYPVSDILILDLEEGPGDWIKARDFLNQPSMFADSKVLVLKNSNEVPMAEGGKELIKILKSGIENPRVFVFISDAKKPLKAFSFLLEPPAKSQLFDELAGKFLEVFAKQEAARMGLDFEKDAWKFLLECFKGATERSWVLVNEFRKISLSDFSRPIKLADLKKTIGPALDDEVFGVAREIMWSRSWGGKIGLLEKLLLQKKEPAHIFNSLAYLAKGKELIKMADYDVAIKSGNLEYEEALLDFIL